MYSAMDIESLEKAKNIVRQESNLWKVKSANSYSQRRCVVSGDKILICEKSEKKLCSDSTALIRIQDIHDVRQGWQTDVFNHFGKSFTRKQNKWKGKDAEYVEKCSFSIIHGLKPKSLNFICSNPETCEAWFCALSYWVASEKNISKEDARKRWLTNQFKSADDNKSGGLNFEECLKLLNQLNISMSKEHAKVLFNKANTNKRKLNGEDVLEMEEFINLHDSLIKRPELDALYKLYAGVNQMMTPKQLRNFLQKEQNLSNVTDKQAADLIKKYQKYEPTTLKKNKYMGVYGFRSLMQSEEMSIFNSDHKTIYQDMTRPLTEYYIASSHNTYLVGGQIIGNSTVEGYINALKQGCRCVELDLWDGSDGEPSVTHGYTPTSKILLKDILQDAVSKHAFTTSPYPLILSIENHLTFNQQRLAAKHLENILKDSLYKKSLSADMKQWPSPKELMKKIIIKGKKNDSDYRGVDDLPNKLELAPELSNLITLCRAVKFDNLKTRVKKGCFYDCCSLKEKKGLALSKSSLDDFALATRKHMYRIYPNNKRVLSGNYDPIPVWNAGCQLVALNYQTNGKPMDLNRAKFRGNGNCGLVLKPRYLTKGRVCFNDEHNFTKQLNIKVISGQCIPKPNQSTSGEIVDPYVEIIIDGYPEDNKSVKTKYINDNGFNPKWDEVFRFTIKCPELAFVQFKVRDHELAARDEILGQYTIAFDDIQTGYRHVHLMDTNHQSLTAASIYVHIEINEVSHL